MELNDAATLARTLMDQHGLQDVPFEFDRGKRRFGSTQVWRPSGEVAKITLSRYLTELNDSGKVEDTIRHEIAHALTPLHYHDAVWRAKAREVGAKPQRCYGTDVEKPEAPYVLACGEGCEIPRYRKPSRALNCTAHGLRVLTFRAGVLQ